MLFSMMPRQAAGSCSGATREDPLLAEEAARHRGWRLAHEALVRDGADGEEIAPRVDVPSALLLG